MLFRSAHRAGITTVIIPEENTKDLKDIPEAVLAAIAVVPVKHMDEVLRVALAVANPDEFLREPSMVVDWRTLDTAGADPSAAH